MKINLIYNKYINNYSETLDKVVEILNAKNINYTIQEMENVSNQGDFVLVIGGDGTFLRIAKFYSKYSIPVLGINQGRLGFLAQAGVKNLEQLINAIIHKDFYIEKRLMLKSEYELALNDFVIKGCDSYRASKFYLEINGECVCKYIADGLIISTPTGSTAYGLSAGGPVVYPTLEAISIVPICPHTLNARPLIVPSDEKILIKTADKNLSLSADGYCTKECKDEILIEKSEIKANLAFIDKYKFYSVLRDKMHWGIAPEK